MEQEQSREESVTEPASAVIRGHSCDAFPFPAVEVAAWIQVDAGVGRVLGNKVPAK